MRSALQVMNGNNKVSEWAARITECRNSGLSVREWCETNYLCVQTYYRWQKRLFEMARAQQETQFAEVTQVQTARSENVAVTVRISGAEADIHSGADTATKVSVTAESYRVPIQVTQLRKYRTAAYYICPRCNIAMEREFMAYCDRCGHRLGWKNYKKTELISK